MSEGGQGSLVCGFGDVSAGLGGLAWDLGEPGALMLKAGEVRAAAFAIERGGDATTIEITAGDDTIEASLSPRVAVIRHTDAPNRVEFTATACVAEMRTKGAKATFECPGQISTWAGDPLEGTGTFRHLAIAGGGGALLIATAHGEAGASGHGEEWTSGWILNGDDSASYEETLISTQYNGGGDPTRIGLELWPEDADQTSRAAATRVAGSELGGVRIGGTWAGVFRCHTDGTEGLGTYLLWRP